MRRYLPHVAILVVALLAAVSAWRLVQERPTPAAPEELRLSTPVIREAEAAEPPLPSQDQGGESVEAARQASVLQWGGASPQSRPKWAQIRALVTGYQGEPVSPALVCDGPVQKADLCFPTSLALGPSGEIYVAEPHSTVVRVIANGRVRTLIPTVRRGSPAVTPVAFARPTRVAVHEGQLYVLEDLPDIGSPSAAIPYVRSRVWRVDLTTNEATLIEMPEALRRSPGQPPERALASPDYTWAMSNAGERGVLFLLLRRSAVLRTQSGEAPGLVKRLSGQRLQNLSGQSRSGGFVAPYFASWGMTSLPDGRVVLTYRGVVALVENNGDLRILAGNMGEGGCVDGKGSEARFDQAVAVAWDPHRKVLIVADAGSNAIRGVTLEGEVTTIAGSGSGPVPYDGIGREARFSMPMDVCVTPQGDVLVADSGFNLIRRIAPDGKVTVVAGSGRSYIVPMAEVAGHLALQ